MEKNIRPRAEQNILILGANSAIARAIALEFAAQGAQLYLAGRDVAELQRIAQDLAIRYNITATVGFFNADATVQHEQFLQDVITVLGKLDGVVLAFGSLGDPDAIHNFDQAEKIIQTNFTGAVSILTHCANYFAAQQSGFIIGITSVAGDRGRQSNYVYGAAKGALSIFLQGLRNRLFASGVCVLTVKPGFIDTKMSFGMPGLFLIASPSYAGKKIVAALEQHADIIYVPWFWRYIMLIIKLIPEAIFKRLKL